MVEAPCFATLAGSHLTVSGWLDVQSIGRKMPGVSYPSFEVTCSPAMDVLFASIIIFPPFMQGTRQGSHNWRVHSRRCHHAVALDLRPAKNCRPCPGWRSCFLPHPVLPLLPVPCGRSFSVWRRDPVLVALDRRTWGSGCAPRSASVGLFINPVLLIQPQRTFLSCIAAECVPVG